MTTQTNCNGCVIKSYSSDCYIVSKQGARLGMFKKLSTAVDFAKHYNGTPKHISEMQVKFIHSSITRLMLPVSNQQQSEIYHV